ncbi:MAG: tetratricopeptide (TPR) repeat protein [Marinobacter maritimus]|jgi:tetratricopeptide (TPR) repeat protein
MHEQKYVCLPALKTWAFCCALSASLLLGGCAAKPMATPEHPDPAALSPADVAALNNQALRLKEQNRYREAAVLLETGLQSSPDVAELHYNLGVISELYLLDLDRALRHYRRYQELWSGEDKKITGWIADLERRLD